MYRFKHRHRSAYTYSCLLTGGFVLKGFAAILAISVVAFGSSTTNTTEATSQQQVPQAKSVLITKYDNAVDKIAETRWNIKHGSKQSSCNLSRARKYINNKRKATWGWQEKLLMSPTGTSYAERKSRSCKYIKWIGKRWAGLAHAHFKKYAALSVPEKAICFVFGRYCREALAVSRCESGKSHSVRAHNGQYLGMFQMGSSEREKYGHGSTPLEQAIAANKYFVASGKDWSPWSCKPW